VTSPLIQFIGVHLGTDSTSVVFVDKLLEVSARSAAKVLHAERDAAAGIVEVPPAEWVRAACYALQEAYFQLPVKMRKPWGLGLSGPSGWVALDVEYEPLSPVRITDTVPAERDFTAWLDAQPRARRRLSVVLTPKDYFRFAISRGLAADVTHASRMGLLEPGASQWSEERVAAAGLELSWLPPVFDSHVPTGRLSEEGIRQTGLPGGSWLVAGAHECEARLLAGGDLRARNLLVSPGPGPTGRTYAYGIPTASGVPTQRGVETPEGWSAVRSPLFGASLLERTTTIGAEDGDAMDGPATRSCRAQLEASGHQVAGVARANGAAEDGAALLAAIGSGLVRDWTVFYSARPQKEGGEP
jgi:hypothetical protein